MSETLKRDPRNVVCERSSDYLLAMVESEFAQLNGGLEMVRERWRQSVREWEKWLDEQSSERV